MYQCHIINANILTGFSSHKNKCWTTKLIFMFKFVSSEMGGQVCVPIYYAMVGSIPHATCMYTMWYTFNLCALHDHLVCLFNLLVCLFGKSIPDGGNSYKHSPHFNINIHLFQHHFICWENSVIKQ